MDARKGVRLARLALGYFAARRLGPQSCRFDVVGVSLDETGSVTGLRRLRPAFDLDGWTSGRIRPVWRRRHRTAAGAMRTP